MNSGGRQYLEVRNMVVTYVEHDGTVHEVTVDPGLTAMQAAVRNGVPGIDADCGGACACATCHVYVDETWQDRVGAPRAMEENMLEFVEERAPNSRLSCQIVLAEELDGLVLRLPENQG